jgi:hypothetical protein
MGGAWLHMICLKRVLVVSICLCKLSGEHIRCYHCTPQAAARLDGTPLRFRYSTIKAGTLHLLRSWSKSVHPALSNRRTEIPPLLARAARALRDHPCAVGVRAAGICIGDGRSLEAAAYRSVLLRTNGGCPASRARALDRLLEGGSRRGKGERQQNSRGACASLDQLYHD